VPHAEAEKAAEWEDAPSDDVVSSQTIETETDERGQHRPLVTVVGQGTATPALAALNKREAVGVDKRARSRNVASRRPRA
jgi:hypothetical protein